jgi:hypothetical protein
MAGAAAAAVVWLGRSSAVLHREADMVGMAAAAPVASEASWRRRWFRVCSPREANRHHNSPRSRPRQTIMADPKVRATAQHRAVVASLAPSWAPPRDCLVESRMVLR